MTGSELLGPSLPQEGAAGSPTDGVDAGSSSQLAAVSEGFAGCGGRLVDCLAGLAEVLAFFLAIGATARSSRILLYPFSTCDVVISTS